MCIELPPIVSGRVPDLPARSSQQDSAVAEGRAQAGQGPACYRYAGP